MRTAGAMLLALVAPLSASALDPDEVTGGTPFCSPGNTGNPALAFDGIWETAFVSSNRYDEYVGIDLGAPVRLSKIVLWIGLPQQNFRAHLEVTNDGFEGVWKSLVGELNPPGHTTDYWLTVNISDPTPYRWIRLRDDPYDSDRIELREMKIYGPDTTSPGIAGVSPGDGSTDVPSGPVNITFSETMDHPSVEAAFTVSPAVAGSFTWLQDPITKRDTLQFFSATWKSYTTYTVGIGTGARDPWGNALGAPLATKFTTNDRTPPLVTSVDPAPGTLLAAKPALVTATFSRDLAPDAVNYLTFFLAGAGPDGLFEGAAKDDIWLQVSGIPTSLVTPRKAVLDPSALTMPPGLYRIRIRGTITDPLGNRLDGDYLGSFPTGNGEPGGDCITHFVIGDPGNGSTTVLYRASVTTSTLNVRCGPSTSYARIGAPLAGGTTVSVYEANNGWYRIPYNGLIGWISASYTALVQNTAPVAAGQSVSVAYNTSQSITLTATDANGDPLTYRVVTPPAHGTFLGTPPTLSFMPAQNYSGTDSFTFVANDGQSDSNTATVSITVGPPPADPGNGGTTALLRAAVSVTQTTARTGPSSTYGVVGTLGQGAVVDILEVKNGWYRIKLNGQTAWILADDARTQVALYPVQVTSTSINIRSGPGTGYSILGTYGAGRIVDVYELRSGWYRIVYKGSAAWIYSTLTVKVPAPLFRAKVTSTSVNVRSGPATTYAIVGTLSGGSIVKVYATSGAWYKIVYGGYYRWIYGTYTQKV